VRCGRCGRRMQVAYSGNGGKVRRYACVRGHVLHHTESSCQTLGGGRLEKAVVEAFLDAVTPAGVAATAGAIRELEDQHEQRMSGQRLAVERAAYEAQRAERQFDACEPENRLVARTLERKFEEALATVERERGKLTALEHARPQPLTDAERRALAALARDLPRLWKAATTTDRDRKQLLRTLIGEIVVTVNAEQRRAGVEIFWEGGARSELEVRLNARGPESQRLAEDTIELIRRLAEHHTDPQIAAILSRQGYRTGSGLPFTEARVRGARFRAGIPAAPPPDPESELVTIQQAAAALNVSAHTIRRWLNQGLLPGQQAMPGAAWRIRLSDEVRARFVPEVPDGFVPLNEAARLLGCARQTVLHKVQRGQLRAIHVTNGRRKGLRIEVPDAGLDHLLNE
jgi:excisionase family DNA binding protein